MGTDVLGATAAGSLCLFKERYYSKILLKWYGKLDWPRYCDIPFYMALDGARSNLYGRITEWGI